MVEGERAVKSIVCFFVATALLLAPLVQAREANSDLTAARGALVAAAQSDGGQSFTLGASWNPRMALGGSMGLVGNVGITEFNTNLGGYFAAYSYGALFGYDLSEHWALEGGAGGQYWSGDGGPVNAATIDLNVLWEMSSPLGAFDRIVFGYSNVMVPSMATHLIHLGFEL